MLIILINLIGAICLSIDYKKASYILFAIAFVCALYLDAKLYNLMIFFSSIFAFCIITIWAKHLYDLNNKNSNIR
ncbi:hypothetical protein AVBRAN12640_08775 [Campylobacter sp. RM12640]|uniref:hypothetical protein n=1 Tax=unclassified Campylobacter TaxID=2593542 RepID=UPI0030158602|nr:hypothetical protein [Campylobacter sp. RM12637]MBZ7982629.1 hypothetical protein [Campylobacter sp. RM12640]MBZ7989824.1 hypothetical protein [Campylobacter sp. RM12635]